MEVDCAVPAPSSSTSASLPLSSPFPPEVNQLPPEIVQHILGYVEVETICELFQLGVKAEGSEGEADCDSECDSDCDSDCDSGCETEHGSKAEEDEDEAESEPESERGWCHSKAQLLHLAGRAHGHNTLHWLGEFRRLAGMGVPVGCGAAVAAAMKRLQGVPEQVMREVLLCLTEAECLSGYALWWKMERLVVVHQGVIHPAVDHIRGGLVIVVGDSDLQASVGIWDSVIVVVGDAGFTRRLVPGCGWNQYGNPDGNRLERFWV
jgi:hypothetical protein